MANEQFIAPFLAAWLLWSRYQGMNALPRDDSRSPLPLSSASTGKLKMQEIKDHCSEHSDCGDINVLSCDRETSQCICSDLYSVLTIQGCQRVKQLGEACIYTTQCEFFDKNAVCGDGFCECNTGFYILKDTNGSLCKSSFGGAHGRGPTQAVDQTSMIVMVVCLAVMFLGICVALHLFSKARFRNRRTIFNSPHPRLMHIKLGKKKQQRRASHISIPPHASRHHSFSAIHSPLPVRPVHKTQSHDCIRMPSPKMDARLQQAPLAERESLPSMDDLNRKPEALKNGPAILKATAAVQNGPNSPTVIVTDADGSHTVVSNKTPSPTTNV